METVSLPFEGLNLISGCNNRISQLQNGSLYRWFPSNCTPLQGWIPYHYKVSGPGDILDITSAHEFPDECNGSWGYAKYKITLNVQPINETYTFYFNTLDARYCIDSTIGNFPWYALDWTIRYDNNLAMGNRVLIIGQKPTGGDSVYRTVSSSGTPEYTVWDLMFGRQQPFYRTFFARTTPFGITPQYIENGYSRSLILGTTVILDTVYNNLGSSDRYGYNTVDGGAAPIGNYHKYYTSPPIDTSKNDKGNTYTTPAWYYYDGNNFNYGTKITAESVDTLILKRKKTLWITGIRDINPPNEWKGDTMIFKSGSVRILSPSAEIMTTNGGQVFYEAGSTLIWDEHSCNFAGTGSGISFAGNHTITNGGFFVVDAGGTLTLQDNTTLTFDGASSPLILQSGSQVICGSNSKIEFKNGAHLRANGCTFSCPNGSWQGITLENSTYDTIQNCTFSNAPVFINMNLNSGTRTYFKKIHNNTFNNGTIKITEATNIIFSNNTFNCQSVSGSSALLEISHLISGLPANPVLNILYNTFKGGTFQLKLNGFAASSVPYYIYKNTFEGTNSTARIGFYANQIKGSFKQNTFTDDNYQNAAWLASSNINFLANKMESKTGNTLNTTLGSTSNLAPSNNTGRSTLEWIAGYNELNLNNTNTNSANLGSLYFESGSTVLTDKGRNCFYYYNITPNYHFIGYFPGELEDAPLINASKNHWSPSTPKTWFNVTTISAYSPAQLNCPAWLNQETIEITGTELADMGGIYDTIYISAAEEDGDGDGDGGSLSSANQDRILYYNALIDIRHKQYETALYRLKELVNDYDSSLYVLPALDYIYHSAVLSDTTMNQGSTNTIFTPLKQYYEQVITDYENNLPVVEKSYNCYLMCLVKLKSFTQAISGYENIMNNHPDPLARLKASWDRSAVVLLTGQGGSFPNILPKPSEKFNQRRLLDKKPDKVARKTFKNAEESDNDLSSGKYSEEDKLILDERASKFNPVSRKDFDEKISVDLSVILGLNSNISGDKKTGSIPERFALYQNYPNPFNPVTTIKYALPKDGLITLKVYDILGREVFSVNEFKKAGSHETVFDGSGFASGVYFYSLESNGFEETKKMVLIK